METITLTNEQARNFLLAYQGLLPPRSIKGKSGINDFIKRVGCIQFDPLNIAGHNQELVLQSRISNFKRSMLKELLYKDRALIDGWDKNMSIYCTSDWPYFSRFREAALRHFGEKSRPAVEILPEVRSALEKNGPLSSIELDYNQTVDWSWAPTNIARAALESMYFWGELVIHHKVNTRRIYDFARRHIPENILDAPDPNKSDEDYIDWFILRRLGGVGFLWNKAGDAWLSSPKINSGERTSAFNRLLHRGQVQEVKVQNIKEPMFIRSDSMKILDSIISSKAVTSQKASIIAPLDNLLWDRKLIKQLFNFEYVWEVYKPENQRNYGYYVLPVLFGDKFIARFEPGKDKETNGLIIKNWWWEPGITQSKKMQQELKKCFKAFLSYLETDILQIDTQLVQINSLEWICEL